MEEQYINSIIGQHSTFRGDIEVEGLVRIDGDFIGVVRKAGRVLIGSQGRADAKIHAKVVVIGGAFHGAVYATDRVILLGSCLVLGSIFAPRVLVEQGALLDCSLSIHGGPEVVVEERPTLFRRPKAKNATAGSAPVAKEPSRAK